MKMTAFWDIALRSLIEIDQCFRGVYCIIRAMSKMSTEKQFGFLISNPEPNKSSPCSPTPFLKIHFNHIFRSVPRSCKWLLAPESNAILNRSDHNVQSINLFHIMRGMLKKICD
jgi:hypothetical protein